MTKPAANRLDNRLVADGLVPSRARARDLIQRGFVLIDGVVAAKPSMTVLPGAVISLARETPSFVSRGAEKLGPALDHFCFEAHGRRALDIGASTGGFTQLLLQRGATHVFAIDVGREQLHHSLRGDPRVTALEGFDARQLSPDAISGPVDAITADVSFISLTKVLGPALELAAPGAWLVALIKPQFELTPADIGKGGIVRDQAARGRAVDNVTEWLRQRTQWNVLGVCPSPIVGGSGNLEFLIGAVKNG